MKSLGFLHQSKAGSGSLTREGALQWYALRNCNRLNRPVLTAYPRRSSVSLSVLAGFAGSWRAASMSGTNACSRETLNALAGSIWLFLRSIVRRKWLTARQDAQAELNNPIQGLFVGLAGVATMLVALAHSHILMPLRSHLRAWSACQRSASPCGDRQALAGGRDPQNTPSRSLSFPLSRALSSRRWPWVHLAATSWPSSRSVQGSSRGLRLIRLFCTVFACLRAVSRVASQHSSFSLHLQPSECRLPFDRRTSRPLLYGMLATACSGCHPCSKHGFSVSYWSFTFGATRSRVQWREQLVKTEDPAITSLAIGLFVLTNYHAGLLAGTAVLTGLRLSTAGNNSNREDK